MDVKNLFSRHSAAGEVEKTNTVGGKAAFDFKSFFKPKTPPAKAAASLPQDRIAKPKETRLAVVGLLFLLLLASAAAYLLLPEVTEPVNALLGITEVSPSAPPPVALRPAPVAMVNAPSMVSAVEAISSVAATSGIGAISAAGGISSVAATSAVNTPVSAASAPISQVEAVINPTSQVSGVTIAEPTMPDLPTTVNIENTANPPMRPLPRPRPHNRDIRHCLDLKTNEAIMRCAYPKR